MTRTGMTKLKREKTNPPETIGGSSHVDGPQFLRRAFTTRHSNNIHRHPPPLFHISKTTHLLGAGEDVRVTGIEDGHGGATEQLTAGGTKLDL